MMNSVRDTVIPAGRDDVSTDAKDWIVWQVADSAFPTGGFAHSGGLESAWQHGEVRNRDELLAFIETSLEQLGRAVLPFVGAAHDDPERLEEFDLMTDVFTTNQTANRASRLQGRAFMSAVERTFKLKTFDAIQPVCGHFAPIFGTGLRRLGIVRRTAFRLFVFGHLRTLTASAVRLNIIGPMEAQAMQHRLSASAEDVLRASEGMGLDDIAQTAPLLDIWQGSHDRLYSRLFQS